MEALREILYKYLDKELAQIVISGPRRKEEVVKLHIRPVLLKQELLFQVSEYHEKKVFHQNLSCQDTVEKICMCLPLFRQMELSSAKGQVHVLVSKKGKLTIKEKKGNICVKQADLEHNRKKQYILSPDTPVEFLVDLGVQTRDGKIINSRYDKFRQINRFLEFIEDILPELPRDREVTILDFGCGKSYLTFAMYHYLKELKGYPVRIIGLDLKEDVIAECSRLAEKYGYDTLRFYVGDIAGYEGVNAVDMVVTLHACDTATDYALDKAVRWGAKVILSVPCCQHELNGQIENELMQPLFRYGLIKERMAALITDGLRANILEACGYQVQVLEFIDMEHTPKNILIRAVKKEDEKRSTVCAKNTEYRRLMEFLHVSPTLAALQDRKDDKEHA